jgi:hypothetical protein
VSEWKTEMKNLLATVAICLFGLSIGGQTKRTDFDSKHLEIRYDKFRDRSTVNTKPMNAAFQAGKNVYLCSMAVGYSIRNGEKSALAILFAPGGSGFLAHLNASLDPSLTRVFFSPNADVILLVGDNRYPLQRIDGGFFAPNGATIVAAEISTEAVDSISKAERWDIAVGSLEAHFARKRPFISKGAVNHSDRDKFRAIAAQYAKDIQPSSK